MDGTQGDDAAATPIALEHRHLRSALEFAVAIAQEGQKLRPPLKYPAAFKPYMKLSRLPSTALGPLRRVLEADDAFRTRIAAGAVPELVDPIGILWLQRPDGWAERVTQLLVDADDEASRADAGSRAPSRGPQARGGRARREAVARRGGRTRGAGRRRSAVRSTSSAPI